MKKCFVIALLLIAACSSENNLNSLDSDEGNMSDVVVDTTGIWDDNSNTVTISEFRWLEYDIGSYKSYVQKNREELSNTSLRLLSELQGEDIFVESRICPEEYRNSDEASIFSIEINQIDGSSRFAAAANVEFCGFPSAERTVLDFESVEELHNSIDVD